MISRFTSKCIHNNSKGCYKNCFCYCLDFINHDHNYFGVQEPVVDHNGMYTKYTIFNCK